MGQTGRRLGAACTLALAVLILVQLVHAAKLKSTNSKLKFKNLTPLKKEAPAETKCSELRRQRMVRESNRPVSKAVLDVIDALHSERRREFGGNVELNRTIFSIEVKNSMLNHMKVKLPELLDNYKNPTWLEDHPALHADVSPTSFFHNCYNEYRHMLPPDDEEQYQMKQRRKELRERDSVIRTKSLLEEDLSDDLHYNRRAACAPYFMVIGGHGLSASKTAQMLQLHSRHVLTVNFERYNYWDYRECTEAVQCNADYNKPTFADYKSLHQATCEHARRQSFFLEDGEEFHPDVVGDVFTGFLNWNPCWKKVPGNEGLLTPRITTAHHVHAFMPNLKVIMLMRDPIKKTWGMFRNRHDRHFPWTLEDAKAYHDEMEHEVAKFNECKNKLKMTDKQCVFHFIDQGEDTILMNSMYWVFVEDYKNVFPADHIRFQRFEDFKHDENGEIDDIIHFLGLPSRPVLEEYTEPEEGEGQGVAPFDETMDMLHDFFRPHNAKLKQLIGEKFSWH